MEDLRRGNLELAGSNLGREEQLADIRNQIAIVRAEYMPAQAGFDERSARQRAVLAQLSPEVVMARLAAAAVAADEQSGMVTAKLEAGELGVEGWVERYVLARALFHRRDLKHQAALQTIPTHGAG